MALVKWDPFADLNSLHDQLNTVFNQAYGQPAHNWQLTPVTDIYSDDNSHLTIEVHLPNFREKEVDVQIHKGVLEIRAEHHEKEEDKKRKYMVRESSSTFYRSLALPERADEKAIKASFKNGLLKVTVPFKELPKPTKIAIEGGKAKK